MTPSTDAAVRYEVTADDYREMTAHFCAPVTKRRSTPVRVVGMVIMFVLTYNLVRSGESGSSFAAGMITGLALLALLFWLMSRATRAAQRAFEPRPGGTVLCAHTVLPTDQGLVVETPTSRCSAAWAAFIGVEETRSLLLLKLDSTAAYIVPKRAFADRAAAARFREDVERRMGVRTE